MDKNKPAWKCKHCGWVWYRLSVPEACPRCGHSDIIVLPAWFRTRRNGERVMKPRPLDLDVDIEEILKRYKYLTGVRRRKDFEDGVFHAIELIKQRLKSACEFFLRYKDNPELLVMKHPEFREELKGLGLNVELLESISDSDSEMWFLTRTYTAFKHFDWHKYNEWLFKLAFRDVFGND